MIWGRESVGWSHQLGEQHLMELFAMDFLLYTQRPQMHVYRVTVLYQKLWQIFDFEFLGKRMKLFNCLRKSFQNSFVERETSTFFNLSLTIAIVKVVNLSSRLELTANSPKSKGSTSQKYWWLLLDQTWRIGGTESSPQLCVLSSFAYVVSWGIAE